MKAAKAISTGAQYGCERLEDRRLLTGTWTTVTNAVPGGDGAQLGMDLSDGSIMVHGGGGGASASWYKLTPSNGNYVAGTWSTLHAMSLGRLYFASNVMPNGNVFVVGGEYASAGSAVNSAEIYNPVLNTWTAAPNFPQSNFADDPSAMLPNGTILAGYLFGGQTYIYSPTANTWTATGSKLRGDRSDEETWNILPDGSVLSYDVFSSISTGTPHAQRYVPSTGTWVDAGTPPAQLSAVNVGYELGGGVLLPDGRVLILGATGGRTAYYTPSTNTWAAGPTMPNGWVAADAPVALLPNGNVLLAISPQGALNTSGNYTFPGPTKVYELNTSSSVYTDVTPALSGFSLASNAYVDTFLVAPSGQVMMFNDSGKVAVYTPDGSANSAWAPSITNITNDSGSNVFTLTGYQLNGISEGASYGDDNEMSSNYPIIRLQDQSGNISYARSFNWTATGVASVNSSVSFTMPSGTGAYLVSVVANGIASLPVLDIQMSSTTGENFQIQQNANTNYIDLNLIGSGVVATFYIGAFNGLIFTGDAASNTEVISANLFGRGTTLNGGDGFDYLRVENNGAGTVYEYGGNSDDYFDFDFYSKNLSTTANFTYVYGGAGNNSIFSYDNVYATATTYSVNSAQVNRPGFGGFFYDAAVTAVSLTGGTATDTTNITSTYPGTPFYLYANGAMNVNIGSSGSTAGISAAITLVDSPSFMNIVVDDSTDSTARTITMGTYTPAGDTAYGYISGMGAGNINYRYADTTSLSVFTGTSASNVVNILADGKPITLHGGAGSRTVNIGTASNGAQGIISPIVLDAASGSQTVNIDDSLDTTARTTTLTTGVVNGFSSEIVSGLAPAAISMYFSGTTALTLRTGRAPGTVVNVVQDSIATTSIIGNGLITNHDVVNLGNAGSLADVIYPISVTNPSGYTDIVVNNSADTRGVGFTESSFIQSSALWGKLVFPTYTIFGTLILSSSLTFAAGDVTSLTVNVGSSTTFTVQDTATSTVINEPFGGASPTSVALTVGVLATTYPLTVVTSSDYWTVNAGNAGSVQALLGAVTVTAPGFGSYGALTVDDSADAIARTVSVSDSQIVGLAPATITYPQFRTQYNISGGTGGNTFAVSTTPVGGQTPVNFLNSGSGNDTVSVNATQASFTSGALVVNAGDGADNVTVGAGTLSTFNSPVTVNGGNGVDSLLLADQLATGTDTYTVTSTTVTRPNFNLTYGTIESLDLEGETGNNTFNVSSTAVGTPVTLFAGNSFDTINVFRTDPTAPVTIKPSLGSDTVNVDTTGTPNAVALFAASQQIGVLTVGTNGRAVEATGPRILLQTTGVVTTGTGTLDMNGNDLTVNPGNVGVITSLVRQGLAGGTWLGAGIDSSRAAGNPAHTTALGVVQNNQGGTPLFSAANLFDGYAPAAAEVLTRYTYYGDANIDGKVDGSDYSRIDNGFLAHNTLTGWFNGDFNYDGVVDGSDYTLIDNAYNRQNTVLPTALVAADGRSAVIASSNSVTRAADETKKKTASVASELDALK